MANSKGSSARAANRRIEVLKLRQEGLGFREIASRVKFSVSQVFKDFKEAIAELASFELEEAQKVRALEVSRLDKIFHTLWPKAKAGDLLAIDRVLRIINQRAELYGLAGAKRIQWTGSGATDGAEPTPQSATNVTVNVINQQTAQQVKEVAEVAQSVGMLERILALPEVSATRRIEIEGDHAGNGNGHGAGNGAGHQGS